MELLRFSGCGVWMIIVIALNRIRVLIEFPTYSNSGDSSRSGEKIFYFGRAYKNKKMKRRRESFD